MCLNKIFSDAILSDLTQNYLISVSEEHKGRQILNHGQNGNTAFFFFFTKPGFPSAN